MRGIRVLERGWLSSNNVLLLPTEDDPPGTGATLVDTGHVHHAAQTLELVNHALGDIALTRIVNTHLHSDHCGGNSRLQAYWKCPVWVAPGMQEAVAQWSSDRLTYRSTGQHCEPFVAQAELAFDQPLRLGGRAWEVHPAAGHDPDSVILFDRQAGVLISADALWENGFGVVFPEVAQQEGFDDVHEVLERIASWPVKWVIPGHGPPFADVAAALQRARTRLQSFREDPRRHARYAAKVLMKYHLMEVQRETRADLARWADTTPFMQQLWDQFGKGEALSFDQWAQEVLHDLLRAGAVALTDDQVCNA